MVLQNFDCHNFIGPLLPAFGHLTEGAPAEELQHLVLVVKGGVEDFMLDQLVVTITVGAPPPRPAFTSPTRLGDQKFQLCAVIPCSSLARSTTLGFNSETKNI